MLFDEIDKYPKIIIAIWATTRFPQLLATKIGYSSKAIEDEQDKKGEPA